VDSRYRGSLRNVPCLTLRYHQFNLQSKISIHHYGTKASVLQLQVENGVPYLLGRKLFIGDF